MKNTITPLVNLFVLIVFGSACFSSCSTQKEIVPELITEQEDTPVYLDFATVWKGALFGGGEEGIEQQNVCIRTQEEWDALKLRIDSQNNVSENFTENDLNFNSEMLIICFDKVRPNGGYSIEIKSVIEFNESIQVKIVSTAPTGPATSVLIQPFHIIRIIQSEKPVEFNL